VTPAIPATGISPNDERVGARAPAPPPVNPLVFAGALQRAERAQSAQLVAAVRTRLDSGQASAALGDAYRNVFGEAPRPETLKILTAQWAHETGNGASMFNYNFGGIKGASPEGLSVAQRTREGFGANEQTIVDNFRAYRTAEDGATDYVRLLARRFPAALDAARAGDPQGFVRALKASGYFTGSEVAYTRSIVALSGVPLPEGVSAPPPRLDAPALGDGRADARVAEGYGAPMGVPYQAPLVDALTLADEISRAALRIARSTNPERGT
jgi:hypothetical protein